VDAQGQQMRPVHRLPTSIPGDNLIRYLERKSGHALNLLSLSGGGQNGAFGAGFLNGWRESGRRPQFDVVGGVSTGALLAMRFSAPLPTMRHWKRCIRKSRKMTSTTIGEYSAFYLPTR
jgi:predicted acylesterase/phospholipase RssA